MFITLILLILSVENMDARMMMMTEYSAVRVGGVGYYYAAAVIVVSPASLFLWRGCCDCVRGRKQGAPRAVIFGAKPADCGPVDDGQTNSVLFHLSVWPSTVVPSQRTRVDDGQINSISFVDTVCLADEHRSETADSGG